MVSCGSRVARGRWKNRTVRGSDILLTSPSFQEPLGQSSRSLWLPCQWPSSTSVLGRRLSPTSVANRERIRPKQRQTKPPEPSPSSLPTSLLRSACFVFSVLLKSFVSLKFLGLEAMNPNSKTCVLGFFLLYIF